MLRHVTNRILAQGPRFPAPSAAATRLYHERVVDHYDNPRNVGSFDKNDPNVGTGLVGAPACGDVMKLQIRVDNESGKIVDACFKTFGCGSAIASSSVATEWVKGKQTEEVLTIKNTFTPADLHLAIFYVLHIAAIRGLTYVWVIAYCNYLRTGLWLVLGAYLTKMIIGKLRNISLFLLSNSIAACLLRMQ